MEGDVARGMLGNSWVAMRLHWGQVDTRRQVALTTCSPALCGFWVRPRRWRVVVKWARALLSS